LYSSFYSSSQSYSSTPVYENSPFSLPLLLQNCSTFYRKGTALTILQIRSRNFDRKKPILFLPYDKYIHFIPITLKVEAFSNTFSFMQKLKYRSLKICFRFQELQNKIKINQKQAFLAKPYFFLRFN